MVKGIRMLFGVFALVGLLVGCQSMTGQTTGEYIDDAGLTAAVKTKMTNRQVSSLTRVEVETVNGVVHLTGVVKSDAEKAEASRLAKEVKGVKRVDNDLTVQRPE
ncbi:MAG: BON domain-containing protein [Nitrospirales bacterium]